MSPYSVLCTQRQQQWEFFWNLLFIACWSYEVYGLPFQSCWRHWSEMVVFSHLLVWWFFLEDLWRDSDLSNYHYLLDLSFSAILDHYYSWVFYIITLLDDLIFTVYFYIFHFFGSLFWHIFWCLESIFCCCSRHWLYIGAFYNFFLFFLQHFIICFVTCKWCSMTFIYSPCSI